MENLLSLFSILDFFSNSSNSKSSLFKFFINSSSFIKKFLFFVNFTNKEEERVKERTKAASKVEKTVIGIYAKNLPITQGRNIIGKKATNVVSVQLIRGDLKSLIANIIAEFLLYHSFIFSLAHSIITITVSIAIQRVNIREKLVRKFKLNHNKSKTIKVIKNASGNRKEAITDSLNHTKINIVKKTNTIVVNHVFDN
jgi:hypothetical protein